MQKDFYINDQFLVKPGSYIVIDGKISRISRIPKHTMQLLCTLANHAGESLSKDELIRIAWRGQHNEEAFAESITALQKLLKEDKKEMLRIVPEKTYTLHAAISNADIDDLKREAGNASPYSAAQAATKKWIFILSILIVILALIFVLFNYTWGTSASSTLVMF
jgi:DNA-binding winged helix-turn-helix (wHTH) protein